MGISFLSNIAKEINKDELKFLATIVKKLDSGKLYQFYSSKSRRDKM